MRRRRIIDELYMRQSQLEAKATSLQARGATELQLYGIYGRIQGLDDAINLLEGKR